MILEVLLLIVGIFLLIKGADSLVDGSVTLSKRLGVSSLIIGLTVVSFGTSMPELLVNLISGFQGQTDIALGNIIGSNLANILLVLGLTAVFFSVKVERSVIWKEIPFSLLAALVLFIAANDKILDFSSDSVISRGDGLLLLGFFVIFIYYSFDSARKSRDGNLEKVLDLGHQGNFKIALLIVGGIVSLFLGGKFVVDSVITLSASFGFSQFLISSTVIAIGTSLPELITSLTAAKKGHFGISVGNVVGSNIFNVLFVLGITSSIFPIAVSGFVNMDLIFVILVSVLLFAFMFMGEKHRLSRWQGLSFVGLYVLYLIFNVYRG